MGVPGITAMMLRPAERAAASGFGRSTRYALRTFCSPSGMRGMAVETAWLSAHLTMYPLGLLRERERSQGAYAHYRTETLSPNQRSLVVSDMTAAGTPILLLHGMLSNRSAFTVLRRALRRRGFGVVHGVNYSLLTALNGDVRRAAHELRGHVDRLRERTGSERVHVIGHSLGGLIARYYVQRLGGDDAVHTLATLGTPHRGTAAAGLLPTRLTRQLRPGSELLTELEAPAPHCRTRFLVVYSHLDQLIVPQRNARLDHPDLRVNTLELRDVGHLSLPIHSRTVHWVATSLTQLEQYEPRVAPASHPPAPTPATLSEYSWPAS